VVSLPLISEKILLTFAVIEINKVINPKIQDLERVSSKEKRKRNVNYVLKDKKNPKNNFLNLL
jgi:hypothetical protein